MKERHLEILDIVNERERISVQELSEKLGLSVVTIRKDLEELESDVLPLSGEKEDCAKSRLSGGAYGDHYD